MKKDANVTLGSRWNPKGWQSFHRKEGSRSCSVRGCSLCTAEDTCLQCGEGHLLFRPASGRLSCRVCETVPLSVQEKREECRKLMAGKAHKRSSN